MMLLVANACSMTDQEPQPFFSSIDLPHFVSNIIRKQQTAREKKWDWESTYICIYVFIVLVLFDSSPPIPISISNLILGFFFFWSLDIYFFGPFSIFFSLEYPLSTSRTTPFSAFLQIYFFFGGTIYLDTLLEGCLFSRPGLTLLT